MPLEKPKHIQLQWNVLQLIHNAVQFEWTINLYKQKRTHGWLNNKQTYNHDDKSWLKFHKRHDGEVRTKPINNADTVSCLASEDSDSSINGETSCIVYGLSLPFYFQHQTRVNCILQNTNNHKATTIWMLGTVSLCIFLCQIPTVKENWFLTSQSYHGYSCKSISIVHFKLTWLREDAVSFIEGSKYFPAT